MKTLKILAAPLALAVGLTALASPASAQWRNQGHMRDTPVRSSDIRNQINDLQQRVQRNDFAGRISGREAAGIRQDVFRLRTQFQMYNRDGLSPREYSWLTSRIDNIRGKLRMERRDWNDRRN